MSKQPRYLIELKNSNVHPITEVKTEGTIVKIAELDIPNYCKNIAATGYKLREWVKIFANDSKPKYTLDQLNEMISKPSKALTREEKLEARIAQLEAMTEGKDDFDDDEDLIELRAQYEELYGKKPDGRMKKETLIKKIEEKQ